jgi:hypothetical protein
MSSVGLTSAIKYYYIFVELMTFFESEGPLYTSKSKEQLNTAFHVSKRSCITLQYVIHRTVTG